MTTEETLHDLTAQLKQTHDRVKYHTAEMSKYASWCEATRYGAAYMPGTVTATTLLQMADHADGMMCYHRRNANAARADMTRLQDMLNDYNRGHAQALRAAAEAADMVGAPGLATELNRRAARAEGYDPDEDDADRARDNEPTGPTQDLT